MWIRCPNGVDTIVNDQDHIKRLLGEGGMPIPDKPVVPVYVSPEEQEKTEKKIALLAGIPEQVAPLPMLGAMPVQISDMPLPGSAAIETVELNKKPGRGSRG